jgi:hypothetical protein
MKRNVMLMSLVLGLGLGGSALNQVQAGGGGLLFSEDFNSVTLGDSVNERLGFPLVTAVATDPNSVAIPNAFSHTGPAGWVVDNNWNNFGNAAGDLNGGVDLDNPEYATGDIVGNVGVLNQGDPDNGVAEWEGWSFADKDFWVDAAGDQDRSLFTLGSGTVLVADSDEYDDLGTGRGGVYYSTGASTGDIDVSAYANQPIVLNYDSAWRDEGFDDSNTDNATLQANWEALDPGNVGVEVEVNNQTAAIWAAFDGGTPQRLDLFDSQSGSPTRKDDTDGVSKNESLSATAFVPDGAANVKFTFGYLNGANDWYWAIDNLELKDFGDTTTIWSENFDAVPLGPSVNERQSTVGAKVTAANDDPDTSPRPNSFTHAPPAGWTTDNVTNMAGTPALDPVSDNNVGSFDLEAWSFVDADFWTFVDGQGRGDFTRADGKFAVADGDEWDDIGDPDGGGSTYQLDVLMKTPVIDLQGNTESLNLTFDSSWRREDGQFARITADFGNGPVEVLLWTSTDDANRHDDNTNEFVVVTTDIPAGATTVQYEFQYSGADDWWWAIDNVSVTAIPEPTSLVLAALGAVGLGFAGRRRS